MVYYYPGKQQELRSTSTVYTKKKQGEGSLPPDGICSLREYKKKALQVAMKILEEMRILCCGR